MSTAATDPPRARLSSARNGGPCMSMTMTTTKLDAQHRSVERAANELSHEDDELSAAESESEDLGDDGDTASTKPPSITLNSVALSVDVDWETQIAIDAFLDSHS